jgi:sterol desaturase/sphingolipid hydroxylase (fatty acid hydroxylase superfamily)
MFWPILFAAIAFVVLGLLRQASPCNPGQPRWISRDMGVDALWWCVALVLYGDIAVTVTHFLLVGAGGADGERWFQAVITGHGPASHLPIVVQAGLVIVLVDIIQYWLHRAFHTKWLWPFHAIHHSPESLDWTATWRIHPVNFIFYETVAAVVTLLMGCSPMALVIVYPFNFFSAALVHANLNWTFGPFRFVLASPVFHRWHHASDPAIHDKNFAPTFPVLDLLFGTFHMPQGELPQDYGAEGVPAGFLGQLLHPFSRIGQMLGEGRSRAREVAARL